jgi:anti-sigma factor (TIGR02949 family)
VSILDRYTCEEVFRRFDDFADRELTPDEMRLVEEHMAICERCAQEFAFEKSVLAQVRAKLNRVKAPPGLLSKISRALSEASGEPDVQ